MSAVLAPRGKHWGPSVKLGLNSCLLCLAAILCLRIQNGNLQIQIEFITGPSNNIICCYKKKGCLILMKKVWGLKVTMHSSYILNHSVKLILIDDDILPILPKTIQIHHNAKGSESSISLIRQQKSKQCIALYIWAHVSFDFNVNDWLRLEAEWWEGKLVLDPCSQCYGSIHPMVWYLGTTPDKGITGRPQLGTQMVKRLGLDARIIENTVCCSKG